ncbi:hypothetical protein [Campylobacter pinnipediorum]|uniref:hypothetical protein n=1 Tax=Campylobacter pinnipediorum TaxID=1965231 RepID=UPI00084CF1F6|nr:hypothetical protein [Campylobacter pinnipediorum]
MLSIKEYLIKKYKEYTNQNINDCIRISYHYNKIKINLYFDAYDKDCPNLTIVLINNNVHYNSIINIDKLENGTPYLPEITKELLSSILDENKKLASFYNDFKNKILNSDFNIYSYANVHINKNTRDYNKGLFLHHIRRAKMSDAQFKILSKLLNIDTKTLRKIQASGKTIVLTSNYEKRKKLIVILEKENINI